MEVVITGRHITVPDWFRNLAEEKLAKVGQLAPKAYRANVELSHERNPRQSSTAERVEITLRGKGPVIRAEACADDPAAALDLALGKLLERLRRNSDRRKVHHGRQRPASVRIPGARDDVVAAILADPTLQPLAGDVVDQNGADQNGADQNGADQNGADQNGADQDGGLGDSPVVIRTKDHSAVPMTVEQALYEMELVGHDFYLFVDASCGRPSVVYRRRGWNYGLIRLSMDEAGSAGAAAPVEADVVA